MNNCSIVIGSFYGDEGKGHMTDIICSKEKDTLNVRFNGGAQASHTVQNTDGTRHAFRHFGSGTFSGATTYLSSDFIVNPVAFVLEADELKKKFDLDACAIVNPKAIVTIPWDMYINQIVERYRKGNRHGSCGFGINETILRNKNPKYRITVEDLIYERNLIYKMFLIRDEYIKSHLKDEYGLDFESIEDRSKFECKDEINMFVFYAKEFLSRVHIKGDSVFKDFKNVVFEGAQGLLLDKDNTQNFPHVTPSKTGITNVLNTLSLNEDLYDGNINIYYMSRCYITRHGAGPLKNELEKAPYSKICDLTNIENEFQGKLRYAYLDLDQLIQNINDDLKNLINKYANNTKVYLTLTCFDEMDDEIRFYVGNSLRCVQKNDFFSEVLSIIKEKISYFEGIYVTYGPTKDDIFLYKDKNSNYIYI